MTTGRRAMGATGNATAAGLEAAVLTGGASATSTATATATGTGTATATASGGGIETETAAGAEAEAEATICWARWCFPGSGVAPRPSGAAAWGWAAGWGWGWAAGWGSGQSSARGAPGSTWAATSIRGPASGIGVARPPRPRPATADMTTGTTPTGTLGWPYGSCFALALHPRAPPNTTQPPAASRHRRGSRAGSPDERRVSTSPSRGPGSHMPPGAGMGMGMGMDMGMGMGMGIQAQAQARRRTPSPPRGMPLPLPRPRSMSPAGSPSPQVAPAPDHQHQVRMLYIMPYPQNLMTM
jgi:hypothetical protein